MSNHCRPVNYLTNSVAYRLSHMRNCRSIGKSQILSKPFRIWQWPAVAEPAQVLEGASRLDAARRTGMDRQTLRDWVHRYNEAAIEGLISRVAPGAAPKLTEVQMAELRELVVAGPDPEIHQVVRWRCIDLCGEVARRFSVTVPERTIGKWLRKLELTRLQPRPYHPKKDEAAQQAFKKTSVLA